MSIDSSLEHLIERIRVRDGSALAALHAAYAGRVYAVSHRILRSHADSEEVVQEVFFQAWRDAAKFEVNRGTVESWLLMMARSRSIDRVRHDARRPHHQERSSDFEQIPALYGRSADELLVEHESSREVRHALGALPAGQRVAVELGFFEGLTHAEIAEVLSQPLGTVKTRMRLALQRLRSGLSSPSGRPEEPREPSPFTVALAEYLARRPVLLRGHRMLKGVHVVAVDDDAETTELLRTILESAGARVTTARSTSDGVQRFAVEWPDVLMADLSMPGEDGYALLRQIRALAFDAQHRFSALAFTGRGESERAAALNAGFADHLSKPIQPQRLLDAVARVTGRNGSEQGEAADSVAAAVG